MKKKDTEEDVQDRVKKVSIPDVQNSSRSVSLTCTLQMFSWTQHTRTPITYNTHAHTQIRNSSATVARHVDITLSLFVAPSQFALLARVVTFGPSRGPLERSVAPRAAS